METEVSILVHLRQLLERILIHLSPVHALIHCYLKIHFNIILSSTARYSKWRLPSVRIHPPCVLDDPPICSPPPPPSRDELCFVRTPFSLGGFFHFVFDAYEL